MADEKPQQGREHGPQHGRKEPQQPSGPGRRDDQESGEPLQLDRDLDEEEEGPAVK